MKILLLDADGVVIKKHAYFSEKFAKEYNVPLEHILPFFKNEFRKCQLGLADVKEELAPYLEKWNWEGSVESFLDYWFETDTEIDDEVMELVQNFREQGIKCYLVTDQEKYRADFIREKMHNKLDDFFFSCELGFSKDNPEFFRTVLNKLDTLPEDIAYVDDDNENVTVAKALGIDAHFYSGVSILKNLL